MENPMDSPLEKASDDELVSIISSDPEEDEDEAHNGLSLLRCRSRDPDTQAMYRVGWVFMGVAVIVAVCAWMAGWPFLPACFGGPETQVTHFWSGSDREVSAPATLFLWSSRLHEVATRSLMKCSPQYLRAEDRPIIESIVRDVFRNASVHCEHLQTQKLSPSQQELLLALLALVGEQSIQQVGLDVARAMQGVNSPSEKSLKDSIEQALKPNAGHLVQLRDELLPKTVQQTLDGTQPWVATLEPTNVRMMKGIDRPGPPASRGNLGEEAVTGAEKHGVAAAGAREEVRLILSALEELLLQTDSNSNNNNDNNDNGNTDNSLRGRGGPVTRVAAAQQLRKQLRQENLRCTAPPPAAPTPVGAPTGDELPLPLGSAGLPAAAATATATATAAAGTPEISEMGERSLVDAGIGQPLTCSSGDLPTTGGQQRQTLTLLCALRFGTQGFEALRAGPKLAAVALPDSAYTADGEAVGVGNIGFT